MQTCISVRNDRRRILLDCGATVLTAMRRYHVDPLEVDTVLLSHLHGDHFAGLPFLILDGRVVSRRRETLTVIGPHETGQRVRAAMKILFAGQSMEDLPFEVRFLEYEARKPMSCNGRIVTAFPALHSERSNPHAVRVESGGKTVAYSGDSAWTGSMREVSRSADLFVCEVQTFDTEMPNHMSYATLMKYRDELDCGRILLTHMGSEMLDRLDRVELETAEDGMRVVLD
jgi:ribonuclease BN (tRNA processing enzyme)